MVKQPLYAGIPVAPAKDVVETGGRTERLEREAMNITSPVLAA